VTAPTPTPNGQTNGLHPDIADPGNLLLAADLPFMFQVNKATFPGLGDRLVTTWRSGTTTFTVMLTAEQCDMTMELLAEERKKMSSLIVPAGDSMPIRAHTPNGNHP
jgi:hypothetical protein